jgi:hypothetical protein
MRRLFPLILLASVLPGCTKEEPSINATMQATCRNCIVSRAIGAAQSKKDTLRGTVVAPGDTAPETRSWNMELKEGDNIFLRACRLYEDTAYGGMDLRVAGDVRPMAASGDTSAHCVEINAPGVKP